MTYLENKIEVFQQNTTNKLKYFRPAQNTTALLNSQKN